MKNTKQKVNDEKNKYEFVCQRRLFTRNTQNTREREKKREEIEKKLDDYRKIDEEEKKSANRWIMRPVLVICITILTKHAMTLFAQNGKKKN